MPASDNKINLVGNKLNHMYYLIWSSGCLFSLPVIMCMLCLFANLTGLDTCDNVTVVILSRISRRFEITDNVNSFGTDSRLTHCRNESQSEQPSLLLL